MSRRCNACRGELDIPFLDLGSTPLANSLLDSADQIAPKHPLEVRVCAGCYLAQVADPVDRDLVFSDYPYFSSVSSSWSAHAEQFAKASTDSLNLDASSLVVEIASNDGYLLRHFMALGIGVLGIEPAETVAEAALSEGIPTEVTFFGLETAQRLLERGQRADLVVANNVLAHVPDLGDFVSGLSLLLKPGARISLEFPHLAELIRGLQFDTIYHEHYSYLSFVALAPLLASHGLSAFDVERLPTHGGSLRLWVARTGDRDPSPAIGELVAEERAMHLEEPAGYEGFSERVERCREEFVHYLAGARRAGPVVGYGAAAKGATFLNYCGVGPDEIPFVADLSPHKQGKLIPGCRIPVVDPAEISQTMARRVLVLPWNLIDEIAAQLAPVTSGGARLFTAVPSVCER